MNNLKTKKIKKIQTLFFTLICISIDSFGDMDIFNTYQFIHDHLSLIYSVDKYRNAINARDQKQALPDILLTPGERRSIILQSFAQRYGEGSKILTRHAVQDLHLLSGTQHSPAQSLLSNIGSPITVVGEIMLANLLISPITDVEALQKRQQALQYMIDHPKVIFQLEEYLMHYAADEDGLIALLDTSDVLNSHLFHDIDYQTYFPGLTYSSTHEEITRRLKDLINIMGALNAPLGLIGSTFLGVFDTSNSIIPGVFNALRDLPAGLTDAIYHILQNFHGLTTPVKIFTAGSFAVLQIIAFYRSYRLFQDNRAAYNFIMERSRKPGRALECAKELKRLLEYHPALEEIMEFYNGFLKFRNSTQIQEITTLLKGSPERTPDTLAYISTNMGRYKRSLTLLRRNQSSMIRIMQATGEVDAWLTVAKLLRSSLYKEKNPYTFAKYETDSEKPVLQIQDSWSPLLSPETAIPSNILTGHGIPQNTIITGPNAAGKSTAIDGIAINVIMAQTLGITASTFLKLTPFDFIHTHMKIEPEIISGVSSFNAESKRAVKLLTKLRELPKNQFSITFLDEIFSNTTPEEGELGALAYMKALGDIPQAINISSTYYSKLSLLADNYPLTFQNLHVSADINSEGQLRYDYVLKPGFSTKSFAFHILEEEGIDQNFLDIIQEILDQAEDNNPENTYRAPQ